MKVFDLQIFLLRKIKIHIDDSERVGLTFKKKLIGEFHHPLQKHHAHVSVHVPLTGAEHLRVDEVGTALQFEKVLNLLPVLLPLLFQSSPLQNFFFFLSAQTLL